MENTNPKLVCWEQHIYLKCWILTLKPRQSWNEKRNMVNSSWIKYETWKLHTWAISWQTNYKLTVRIILCYLDYHHSSDRIDVGFSNGSPIKDRSMKWEYVPIWYDPQQSTQTEIEEWLLLFEQDIRAGSTNKTPALIILQVLK